MIKHKWIFPLLAIVIIFSFSCKNRKKDKEDPVPVNTSMASGLPENPRSIHGYLYASYQRIYFDTSFYHLNAYASFAEPARNLITNYNHYKDSLGVTGIENKGNISVGTLQINDKVLFPNSDFVKKTFDYEAYMIYNFLTGINNLKATWRSDGNRTFYAFDKLEVPRGFPAIYMKPFEGVDTLNLQSGITFQVGKMVKNYDSAFVRIQGFNADTIRRRMKTILPGQTSVNFSAAELNASFWNSISGDVTVMGFNYTNRTIEDKVYVFELSNKGQKQVEFRK